MLNERDARPTPLDRSGLASFGQEQLWLVEQVVPGTSVSNDTRAWDLHGPLDSIALQAVTDQLVASHEALRTSLRHQDGHLWQQVGPAGPAVFVHRSADSPDAAVTMLGEFVAAPFDLADAAPLRAILIRIRPEHHLFAMVIHHSAGDGQSWVCLREELASRYAALLAGRPVPTAAAGADYLDFAEQERAHWAANSGAAQDWLEGLRKAAGNYATLPACQSRVLVAAARALSFDLPQPALDRLLSRAAETACTPNMALTALFAVTLSRWTGRPRILFSSPVSSRLDPQFHRTVGMFVNSMPMLLDLTGNPGFGTLLGRARAAVLDGLAQVQVPPAQIQAALADGAPATDLLHQVTLAVERTGPSRFTMADVTGVDRRLCHRRRSSALPPESSWVSVAPSSSCTTTPRCSPAAKRPGSAPTSPRRWPWRRRPARRRTCQLSPRSTGAGSLTGAQVRAGRTLPAWSSASRATPVSSQRRSQSATGNSDSATERSGRRQRHMPGGCAN